MMRVWQINDDLWIAGETLLRAVRASARDMGYGFREMVETIDGDMFREIVDWQSTAVFCPENPEHEQDQRLGNVLRGPGLAMCGSDWL